MQWLPARDRGPSHSAQPDNHKLFKYFLFLFCKGEVALQLQGNHVRLAFDTIVQPTMRYIAFAAALSLITVSTMALQVPTQTVKPASLEKGPLSTHKFDMKLGHAFTQVESVLGSSTFWGAALAGGLHAIAGPDHYPALLPRCLGKRWYAAGRIGAVWGIGHSISGMALGILAFVIKEKAFTPGGVMSKITLGADLAAGLSMIFVGIISFQESHQNNLDASQSEIKADLLVNGLFHGLAIDGLPAMMPVLAAGSLPGAVAFLLSYAAGGTGAMALATILIGHGTASLSRSAAVDVDRVVRGAALAAVVVGSAWIARAFCAHA